MNLTLEQVQAEIKVLADKLGPIAKRLEQLRQIERRLLSKRFIEVNGIKREDVEMSKGDGKPYFGHVKNFAAWIEKQNVRKPWMEWNETIYRTADVLLSGLPYELPPARLEDVPE